MKQTPLIKHVLSTITFSLMFFGITAYWLARAQQTEAGSGALITGSSTSLDTEGLRVSHRRFEAGARSAWHRHTHGQLLFVESGRARTQKRGGTLREMGAQESDYTPPNIEHWHGAVPDQPYVQISVTFGPGIDWLEYVTDEEYAGR